MAIPVDAKHVNNAMAFIDFYLRGENSASMANEMNYPTANTAGLDAIEPEIRDNATIFLSQENLDRLIPPGGYSNEISSTLNDTYNAFKRGK
jgi:putrescine transport system substrate-binding protein